MDIFPIEPATLLSSKSHVVPGPLVVTELFFQVPLNYADPSAGNITLFARSAHKRETPICPPDEPEPVKPYIVFLQGGPGFGNSEPQDHSLTWPAIARGYQILLLDHRGVGQSTPVTAEMLNLIPGGPTAHAEYLSLMRQDNTVRDCEAVRKCLTDGWPASKSTWSIFGQSYGGFISLSYLSMHPEGLREVFLTGGLAPVGRTPDEVYEATYAHVIKRNQAYYAKFPEDVAAVRQIAQYIESKGGSVPLPAGGFLTMPRFLTMGLTFGVHGGLDKVHATVLQCKTSLDQFGFFTRSCLNALETVNAFDTNIIYAILHEAIYCDGPGTASKWSAHRVGQRLEQFSWLRDNHTTFSDSTEPIYFSGEMIFPFLFDTYPELIALKEAAEILANYTKWPPLYDQKRLANTTVPVYAASYIDDMFVDFVFAKDTARLVQGTKVFETNIMYHNALRAKADEVLQQLFNLRDDVLD